MPRVDHRCVLSGIFHALKSGARWIYCPEHIYGPKKTLYNRFRRWAERGVWERVFSRLAAAEDVPARLSIVSSCIEFHRHRRRRKSGGLGSSYLHHQRQEEHQALRNSRRKGSPHVLLLTPSNSHDAMVAMMAINAAPRSEYLVAEATGGAKRHQDYDSNALRSCLIERGKMLVIPSKFSRKVQIEHDRQIYRLRNVVERIFCRFKGWWRVATRFDRNIKNFRATIAIAVIVTWWF